MKKIHLAFLWHQHQPMYKNPVNGIYELPWVRLHACKDYYDTAAILDEFPKIKSNFNLVPSLMIQLEDYANGTAHDKYMDLTLKPASDLTPEDKVFILHNFFMANWDTMVYPFERYRQLLEKRGKQTSEADLTRIQKYFKQHDMRDLQVWFNLAWMDPYWKENDDLIKHLYQKGEKFTEKEKEDLIKKQIEICGMIITKYKELQDKGQIEVSVTPFYHPILPLLCDTNNAKGSTPHITLPKKRFQHRKDSKIQIHKAVEYYKERFGHAPKGMWPSEGSVAEDVVPLFAEAGLNWVATDEEILFSTKPEYRSNRSKLFQPYRVNIMDNSVNIVFRDHGLSDAVGFVYSRWDAKHAAKDFIKNIHAIRDSVSHSHKNHLVSVILDGENCWEYYQNDGWDFLRELYRLISEDDSIETVRINDFIESNPPSETLDKLWPGSWINGNYGIWIGHSEDNTAWDYLSETRKFLTDYISENPDSKHSKEVESAWEKIYMAEGSDWNWWYGDDHSSGNDDIFDFLFRQHLIGVYESLGETAPDYLSKSILGVTKKNPTLEPVDFITPILDGKVSNYFEWHPAGYYQVGHAGGSMHQVETILKAFFYGFDLNNIYLRFDLNLKIQESAYKELKFDIIFLNPDGHKASLRFKNGGKHLKYSIENSSFCTHLDCAAVNKVIELAVPLKDLSLNPDQKDIEFLIAVYKNGAEIERWPYQSTVSMAKPSKDFLLKNWTV